MKTSHEVISSQLLFLFFWGGEEKKQRTHLGTHIKKKLFLSSHLLLELSVGRDQK